MTPNTRNTALAGVGTAAACVACCAGPILAALGAVGLGTVLGVAVFGLAGLVVAALAIPLLLRRRQTAKACAAPTEAATVSLSATRRPAETARTTHR